MEDVNTEFLKFNFWRHHESGRVTENGPVDISRLNITLRYKSMMYFNLLLYIILNLTYIQLACFVRIRIIFKMSNVYPLKGRDVNWLHLAIQV